MKTHYILLVALVLVLEASGQDWEWKNPLPTGNRLNCIKFADSSTVFAVGNYGTILKSCNGGVNWKVQSSNTNSDILSISVIDRDTVYASTRDFSVLKTNNGGETWEKVFKGSYGNYSTYIFFTNPANGFIGCAGMRLFKTSDYGKTWIDLKVGYEFQHVTSVFFTTKDTGYASLERNGEMLKTTDGGLKWSTITLPLNKQFNSIVFTNKGTGYMVGDLGSILKTVDAGDNWLIQNEFPSSLTNTDLCSVDFINDDTGFVVGGRDILKTIDGGKKWELISQSDFDLYSVNFINSNFGITVGGDWLYEVSGILKTKNGGNNWNETSSTITTKYIDKIKFVNSMIGYAIGGHVSATYSGYILKTTDGGESWTNLYLGDETYWLNDISIPDENTIYVIAEDGQFFKSKDAGVTWHKKNAQQGLKSLYFVDVNIGYIVGYNGTILKTIDGGEIWTKQVSPTDMDLYSVYFKDANNGYITCFDWNIDSCTVLLTTTDGGINWNRKNIGTIRYPRKINFLNNDTAFIVGDFGAILKTTDGGNKWKSSYHNGNDYMDIFFTDENIGYVVGANGEISLTENCGKDWKVLNSGTDKQLRSVFFINGSVGFVVGSEGVILKTTNGKSGLKPLNQQNYNLCHGDSILIEPNFVGGTKPYRYYWDNKQTSSSIKVAPKKDTIINVSIFDYMMDSIKIEIPVGVISVETPVINQSGDTLISNIQYGNQWYRNDSLIIGANLNKYMPVIDGMYYSIILNNSCFSEKSNIIQYSIVNDQNRLKPLNQHKYNICKGDTVMIEPNFVGGTKPYRYYWDNKLTSLSIKVAPTKDTIINVSIFDYMMDSIKIEIPVGVISVETPVINQSGDTLISNIQYGNQWYRNDSLIIGANLKKYIPVIDGMYYSIILNNSCSSEKSNIIQYSIVNDQNRLKPLNQHKYNICKGDTVMIEPNFMGGTKPYTYYWNNKQTTSFINVVPTRDTIINVSIFDYMMDSIKIEIPIDVISVETPVINQSGDTLISNIQFGNQWYRNDSLIIGANLNKYIPVIDGMYYSIILNNSCSSEKSNIIQTSVRIIHNDEIDLKIYPNPATNTIFFEFLKYNKGCEVALMDINGRILKKQKVKNINMQIDLSDLNNGIYLIKIITIEQTISKKIIKK